MGDGRKRHIVKAISWRFFGSADTALLGWIFSGSLLTGVKLGGLEVATKTILYYFHERLWYKIDRKTYKWARNSHARHLYKTITWRVIATTDTVLLAWLITG